MDERAYAIELRRGLLIILRALEQRYGLGDQTARQGACQRAQGACYSPRVANRPEASARSAMARRDAQESPPAGPLSLTEQM